MKSKLLFLFIFFLIFQTLINPVSAQTWEELNTKVAKYYKNANYEKAFKFSEKALIEAENKFGKESAKYIVSCVNLAELNRKTGYYKKAEQGLSEAKKITEKLYGKENPAYAAVCNNFAVLYSEIGNYSKAEMLFTEAKDIREKYFGKKHTYYAESCNNLAELYYSLGNYKKAESLLIESNKIYKKISNKKNPYYAGSCNNLAEFYNSAGKYKKAEILLKEAKSIKEKIYGKKHPEYALSCSNLAENYFKTNKYREAEKFFLEAKRIYEKVYGKDHILFAGVCNNLGVLEMKTGKYNEAVLLFEKAKIIIKKKYGIIHPYYVEVCGNLAILNEIIGDSEQNPEKKNERFQKAENLYLEVKGITNSLINKSAKFMSENEREEYLTQKINTKFDNIYSFLLTKRNSKKFAGTIYDDLLGMKGQLLRSSAAIRKAALQSGDTALITAYNKMNFYGKILNEQNLLPAEQRRSDINQIKEKLNNAEKKLIRNSEIYSENLIRRKFYWQEIRLSLNKNEAAVEFFNFRYRNKLKQTDSILYYAVILKQESQYPEIEFLFEQKQLEKLLNRTNFISEYNYIKDLYDIKSNKANVLYYLVWQPIDKYLDNCKNVYISPSGLLNKISFDALPYDSTILLSDKYKIIYTSSTIEAINKSELYSKDVKNSVLFGGIEYNSEPDETKKDTLNVNNAQKDIIPDSLTRNLSWDYLPGSLEEVNEIKVVTENADVDVTLFSGKQAGEAQFKALEKNAPSILHISTHGFYFKNNEYNKSESFSGKDIKFKHFENPLLRSGFILAGGNDAFSENKFFSTGEDGVLTAAEISRLNLFKTKLAVLSACQTGLGDIKGNEGVYGLQRSFKMAGVEYLLFSLWSVPDETTKELMVNFYKNWFAGAEIRDAFKKAQNQLKEKYKDIPGSAFAWAAFVLMK